MRELLLESLGWLGYLERVGVLLQLLALAQIRFHLALRGHVAHHANQAQRRAAGGVARGDDAVAPIPGPAAIGPPQKEAAVDAPAGFGTLPSAEPVAGDTEKKPADKPADEPAAKADDAKADDK